MNQQIQLRQVALLKLSQLTSHNEFNFKLKFKINDVIINIMINFIFVLLFKILNAFVQMVLALQTLVNDFIRYVYLPLFYSLTPQKVVNDIKRLAKVPSDEITFVIELRASKSADLERTVIMLKRYSNFIEDSITPKVINCYLSTEYLNQPQKQQLHRLISIVLQNSQLKIIYESDRIDQSLRIQKAKLTPLVLIFSSYPCINGLPAQFLVGSQISFNPPIIKSTDHDLVSSFQQYAASEQRKGK